MVWGEREKDRQNRHTYLHGRNTDSYQRPERGRRRGERGKQTDRQTHINRRDTRHTVTRGGRGVDETDGQTDRKTYQRREMGRRARQTDTLR